MCVKIIACPPFLLISQVKMLPSLVFVPTQDVHEASEALMKVLQSEVLHLAFYFEEPTSVVSS